MSLSFFMEENTMKEIDNNKSYIPFQTMELCKSYKCYVVPKNHVLYGTVICFYQMETKEITNNNMLCLPDACVDSMFFIRDDKPTGYIQGSFTSVTNHTIVENSTFFGIRYTVGGFYAISNMPHFEFLGQKVDLENVFPLYNILLEELASVKTFEDRIRIATSYLKGFCNKNIDRLQPVMRYIVWRIISTGGNIKCSELVSETAYSDRQIRNICNKYIGVPPKLFCEIVRFQNCVGTYMGSSHKTLENLSFDCNYYDMSHMNKTFVNFTGLAPSAFFDMVDN